MKLDTFNWYTNIIALNGVPSSIRDDSNGIVFNIDPVGLGFGQNRTARSVSEQLMWAGGLIDEPVFCQYDNIVYAVIGVERVQNPPNCVSFQLEEIK